MFILFCTTAIAIRIHQQRWLYQKNETNIPQTGDKAETALKSELNMQCTVDESQKEYFFWSAVVTCWSLWWCDFLAKPGAPSAWNPPVVLLGQAVGVPHHQLAHRRPLEALLSTPRSIDVTVTRSAHSSLIGSFWWFRLHLLKGKCILHNYFGF